MHFFETGLVQVLVGVLGAVVVGVRVFMRDVLVVMRGVRMGMCLVAVVVFVRVRGVMGVLPGHVLSFVRNMLTSG
jgi:hypothetical protein